MIAVDQHDGEQWRPAPGWPAYEVSDLGRVRRGDRILTATPKVGRPGFPLYLVVNLCQDGRRRQIRLNRLVALTWLGAPPRGKRQADHVDGNTLHNCAQNLEWVTQAVNQRRSHALHPRARDERGRILPRAVAL
jgi:hypothetical protein